MVHESPVSLFSSNGTPVANTPHKPSAPTRAASPRVAVVAIDMGYGHLRPARSLARELNVDILHTDRPPLADVEEQRRWAATRTFYESVSRISGIPWIGPPLRGLLNSVTDIPNLYPFRDLSGATFGVKILERSARQGLGRSIVNYLREHDLALLTTFYSPAVLADFHGYDRLFCVDDPRRLGELVAARAAPVESGQNRCQERELRCRMDRPWRRARGSASLPTCARSARARRGAG